MVNGKNYKLSGLSIPSFKRKITNYGRQTEEYL
jgi:hypothetical protein